ncbi:MAG TPA: NlpC/P60 family protein, partial [Actinomycetota bacterium]|nr:NlpC/P60 family protein [Actinomycetota bacterium]
ENRTMRITNKLSIIPTILALSMLSLSPAHAEIEASVPQTQEVEQTPVTSSPAALTFESPAVDSVAAEPAEPPAQTLSLPAALAVSETSQAPAPPDPAPPVNTGRAATIAAAAFAQLGIAQDCTALVSNALAAAGINFHGWPADYLKLGTTIAASEAQPGDLIYYPNGGLGMAHIAVYVGTGRAVHGGWNGGTTALASAFVGTGATFIRVS